MNVFKGEMGTSQNVKRSMKRLILVILGTIVSQSSYAGEKLLSFGVGSAAIFDDNQTAIFKVVYDIPMQSLVWDLKPQLHLIVSDTRAYHIGIGFLKEFTISERWSWAFSTSVGHYKQGKSSLIRPLGNELEFYSAIYVSKKINNTSRVMVELGHISNAGFGDVNPGSELVLVSVTHKY